MKALIISWSLVLIMLFIGTASMAQAPPFDKVKEWALMRAPIDQSGNHLWIIKTKSGQKIRYAKGYIYEPEVMYGLGWFKSLNVISVCRGVGIDLVIINYHEIKRTFSKTILGTSGIESNETISEEDARVEALDILRELLEKKLLK
jgi:hypothetical protein